MLYFFPGLIVFVILVITLITAIAGFFLVKAMGRLGIYFAKSNDSRKNARELSTGIAVIVSGLLFLMGLFYAYQAWNCFPSMSGSGTTGVCYSNFSLYTGSDNSIESTAYGDVVAGSDYQLSYMPVSLEKDELQYIENLASEHRCDLRDSPYRVDGERNESTYYLSCKTGEMEFVCSSLAPDADCWRTR